MWLPVLDHKVNRHTGGLEKFNTPLSGLDTVNRHTGGLEIATHTRLLYMCVNRHTGGLEKIVDKWQ